MKNDRLSDFRDSIWFLQAKILPGLTPEVQPFIANIIHYLSKHFFTPEESSKVYHRLQEYWRTEIIDMDEKLELLVNCAWKLRLYLNFEREDIAYQLFRKLIQIIRKGNLTSEKLQVVGDLDSKEFPLPKIPEKDIRFIKYIAEACQQEQGTVNLKRIAKLNSLTQKEVISKLNKLEVWFDCLLNVDALGLTWIRAEKDFSSGMDLNSFLSLFSSFIIRCELYSSEEENNGSYIDNTTNFILSIEFLYPSDQLETLRNWSRINNFNIYCLKEHHLYQNYDITRNLNWLNNATNEENLSSFITSMIYSSEKILISNETLRIIETYLHPTTFYDFYRTSNELIPFLKIEEKFGIRRDQLRHIAANLFSRKILVRYHYSQLIGYYPDIMLEGQEFDLHIEAQMHLYARREVFTRIEGIDKKKESLFHRLYIPGLINERKYHNIKRIKCLFYTSIKDRINLLEDLFDFNKGLWNSPKLPKIKKKQKMTKNGLF